jgi:hypothetical protein
MSKRSIILIFISLGMFIPLLVGWVNSGLRKYETVIEPFMSISQENTLGLISVFGFVVCLILTLGSLLFDSLGD